MLYTILLLGAVLAAFCLGLAVMHKTNFKRFWPVVGCLAAVQVVLFALLTATGKTAWYLLPLFWMLCIIPMAAYCFLIGKPGLMGRKFTFIAGSMMSILPVSVASWGMALVYRFVFQ